MLGTKQSRGWRKLSSAATWLSLPCGGATEAEGAALEQHLAQLPEGGDHLAWSVNPWSTHLPGLG